MFEWWMWIVFFVVIGIMFVFDLGAFNKGSKHITTKRALTMTGLWVALALSFGMVIYFLSEPSEASMNLTTYITAYVVEEMMSVDNLFVFIIIFAYFSVPDEYQHKALFYGIIGALVFRALFIFAGAELLERIDWMMYVFGAILIYTAVKTVIKKDKEPGKTENKMAERLKRWFNVAPDHDGGRLFTVRDGVKMMTPLLLCIVVIELTDIMFAVDSIPAVLSITTDRFIVYTSNIFAVLGLRSLFFAIKGSMEHLEFLKYGLGAILAFIGVKMLLTDHYHVDVAVSLAVILSILAVTVAVSLYMRKKKFKAQEGTG